jgi:hypothetical protein
MARDAMKEMVKARVQCTDVTVGSLLSRYEKGGLDESTRGLFTEHMGECLHCMALYNIETKHKYGFIDAERTRVRRVEVKLRPWLPSPRLAAVAFVLWGLVISLATVQTSHLNPQETGGSVEGKPKEVIAKAEPSPSTEDNTGRDESASTEQPQREQGRTRSNQDSGGVSRQRPEGQPPVKTANLAPIVNDASEVTEGTETAVNSNNTYPPISRDRESYVPRESPPLEALPPTAGLSDDGRVPDKVLENNTQSRAMQRLLGACSSGNENGC